jgi:hypothetical protein
MRTNTIITTAYNAAAPMTAKLIKSIAFSSRIWEATREVGQGLLHAMSHPRSQARARLRKSVTAHPLPHRNSGHRKFEQNRLMVRRLRLLNVGHPPYAMR